MRQPYGEAALNEARKQVATTAETRRRQDEKERKETFDAIRFCPVCGDTMRRLNGTSTEFKTCDSEHGEASVSKRRSGEGMFVVSFKKNNASDWSRVV